MRISTWFSIAFLFLLSISPTSLWAKPATPSDAKLVVTGWLKENAEPLGTRLGQTVGHIQTFTDTTGHAIYYIVYLKPQGFAIVSADDLLEPIIGFSSSGTYDPSPANPLGALVTGDLNSRIAVIGTTGRSSAVSKKQRAITVSPQTATQQKWERLTKAAVKESINGQLKDKPPIDDASNIDDICIEPLIETQWGQGNEWLWSNTTNEWIVGACYNYYTPQLIRNGMNFHAHWNNPGDTSHTLGHQDNAVAGCTATALAQLIRYYEFPDAIPTMTRQAGHEIELQWWISQSNGNNTLAWSNTNVVPFFGGTGIGGTYRWNRMTLSQPQTLIEHQEVGRLCRDAGVACGMSYTYKTLTDGSMYRASNAFLYQAVDALLNTFGYESAVDGSKFEGQWVYFVTGLPGMINPNLDARQPILLGIAGDSGGHAVVCDGYGFDDRTLYHHLNMGWRSTCDIWYNLPNIASDCAGEFSFDFMQGCAYNIRPRKINNPWQGDGEIVSGRVLSDPGEPWHNVDVYATAIDAENDQHHETTDDAGIFAFNDLNRNTTYRVWAQAGNYEFPAREVTTGSSDPCETTSGNVWGLYFYRNPPAPLYVSAIGSGTSTPDGSRQHPYLTIQDAIDASLPGETVALLPGTYTGSGNRDLDFKGKPITVQSHDPSTPAIIDCQGTLFTFHRAFQFTSGEKATSVVANITIINGFSDYGGGIYCKNNSSPLITGCTFRSNEATASGGGMYIHDSQPHLVACQFESNFADWGGGIYMVNSQSNLVTCRFEDNIATWGGGTYTNTSQPDFVTCDFKNNDVLYRGGAIYFRESDAKLSRCRLTDNTCYIGGAIYNYNSTINATSCLLAGNRGETLTTQTGVYGGRGGAIYNDSQDGPCEVVLYNCTLADNWASDNPTYFSGIVCNAYPSTEFGSDITLSNCILWGQEYQVCAWATEHSTTVSVDFSCVQNGSSSFWLDSQPTLTWYSSNIIQYPAFRNTSTGDYHLLSWSPCIDKGETNHALVAGETDLDGNPRVVDGNGDGTAIIDMGAYEFQR